MLRVRQDCSHTRDCIINKKSNFQCIKVWYDNTKENNICDCKTDNNNKRTIYRLQLKDNDTSYIDHNGLDITYVSKVIANV